MVTIKKGTLIYHGTIHNFDPKDIRVPSWFSTLENQAYFHVCYRHYLHENGRLLTYCLNKDVNVIDLAKSGDNRMFVNAYGNYAFANNIMKNTEYDGYLNFPDQAEIMLSKCECLDFIKETKIVLNKRVKYVNLKNNWRMMEDIGGVDNRCCCIM